MSSRRASAVALAVAATALALIVGGLAFTQVQVITPTAIVTQPAPTPTATAKPKCGAPLGPHYFARDPGKESPNAFGPPVGASTTPEVVDVAKLHICVDWRLMTTLKHVVDGTDPNMRFATHQAWQRVVDDFYGRVVWDKASTGRISFRPGVKVSTFYMLLDSGGVPVVYPWWMIEPDSDYLALPVRRYNGTVTTLFLRLECGLQPIRAASGRPLVLGDF
jgi:hypothetical protein